MKRVIIIHRWAGGPEDDWRPWLKAELEKRGYEVLVPEMPDTETPVIEKWVAKLAQTVGTPDIETFFVGHSIGCQAIMRYLETIATPVGGAVFIAGWFNLENLEDAETEAVAEPWIRTAFDHSKVKAALPQSTLIISDNDPFGCFEENKMAFSDIVTKTLVMPGTGHFTDEDACKQLPEALAEIESQYVESLKRRLRQEGFAHIYEWTDGSDTDYPEHAHKGKVSFYIIEGGIEMNIAGTKMYLEAGQRLDVPVGIAHSGKVGSDGCRFVVGEEIEGDS